MAGNDLQQSLLELSNQIKAGAGGGTTRSLEDLLSKPGVNLADALGENSKEVSSLRTANQSLSEVLDSNTRAILQSGSAARTGSDGGSVGSAIGKVASTIFGSGLGLAPVISSLVSLFGGGKQDPPPPLYKYSPPAPLRLDGANPAAPDSGVYDLRAIDYGQDGLPRAVQAPGAQARTASPSSSTPITIQVQTMDSRSFLDHSNEIAQAVREAMLNMHSINDVVSDL